MSKLIDIIGKAISGEWGNDDETGHGIPVLRTTNFTNYGVINYDNVVLRDMGEKDISAKYLSYGDIIIEKSGGSEKQPVGRVVFFEGEEKKYLFNNFTSVLRVKNNECYPKYLFYALYFNYHIGGTTTYQNKTTGLHNLQLDAYLNSFDVILPPFEEQVKKTKILDKLTDLINLRKKEIEKLDLMVKSRFVEMFGEPIENPNNYNVVQFCELIEYIGDIGSNGANSVVVKHLDMKDDEDYALMVRFLNFTSNDFTNNVKYISKDSYDFFKKSKIYGGELIFCKIGSAGLSYIMPFLNRPVSLGLNQIMVRINKLVNITYLYNYIHTSYGESLINGCINGAVTKSIAKGALKQIPIILPPIEQQEQFADFVKQNDKSKFTLKKSLEKLETLKKSLLQKYFN